MDWNYYNYLFNSPYSMFLGNQMYQNFQYPLMPGFMGNTTQQNGTAFAVSQSAAAGAGQTAPKVEKKIM